MNVRRVIAIWSKDLRDAMSDTRVLMALLMPLLIGLLYSFMFTDTEVHKVKVAYVAGEQTQLLAAIEKTAATSVKLSFVKLDDQGALKRQVQKKKADLGLVLAPGFDEAVAAGKAPQLVVVLPRSPSFGGDYVAAGLDRSLQSMTGGEPAAAVVPLSLPPEPGTDQVALDALGMRKVFVLISTLLLLGMVAIYAVPAVLTEETEKKTIEALTLIASQAEVISAKALFGITYCLVSVPVMLAITRAFPEDVALFVAAMGLTAITLVGVGLLFGGFMKTQQQVNNWSGLALLPLIAPAVMVGLPTPAAVTAAIFLLPTTQTMRLGANAFAGRDLYGDMWLSFLIIAAWGVAAYGLLWWRMSRREDY